MEALPKMTFAPFADSTATLSATTSSSRVAIPSHGPAGQVRVSNTGTVTVFVKFGDVTVTADTTNDVPIPAGVTESLEFSNPTGGPIYIAGITASGSATVYVTRGSGSVDGFAGGGASGGGATAANQANLGSVSTATLTSLSSAATSAQLLASTAGRKGVIIHNTDTNALHIKYGTTATTAIGGYTYKIAADATWEMPQPIYTGRIDAIWAADGAGGASITEL